MAYIDRVREEANRRIMFIFDLDRTDAESIVDLSEGQLFNLDDTCSLGERFDMDISEQLTGLILPVDK